MVTNSSILAQEIPWTEEPGRVYSPWGHKESDTTEHACKQIFTSQEDRTPVAFLYSKINCFSVFSIAKVLQKAECQRIDAFELRCWRRLLRVPWTARRSNQSILKEISPGISLEGMMLTLKLQYFGHLMRRVDSLEKTLMLAGIGGRRSRGQLRIR